MAGFRFLLMLDDGEPADAAMFVTAIPTWREGDEFLAGELLERFRIRVIAPVDEEDEVREMCDSVLARRATDVSRSM
jgi:hypothetical protein